MITNIETFIWKRGKQIGKKIEKCATDRKWCPQSWVTFKQRRKKHNHKQLPVWCAHPYHRYVQYSIIEIAMVYSVFGSRYKVRNTGDENTADPSHRRNSISPKTLQSSFFVRLLCAVFLLFFSAVFALSLYYSAV